MTKTYARPLAMVTLAIILATGMTGCQTMSDLDPTGLLGDDSPAPESQFPTDSNQQAEADAAARTPDLASIPARPAARDTSAQANTTQQVTAAGAQAQYSGDALRAGTDAAAPPPTATDANATRQALAAASAPPTANDAPPSASDAPPTAGSAPVAAPPPTASDVSPSAGAAAAAVAPRQQAPRQAAPPPPVAVASAAPPPVASSAIASPPGAEPAVPAVPMTAGSRRMAANNPTDAELGFRPSSAPALNAGVAKWVSPPILAHYRQTAAQAGAAGTDSPAVPAVSASTGRRGGRNAAPMPQDVIASLDAVPGTPMGMAASQNGGVAPTGIVYFVGDGTSLSKAARAQVSKAVAAFEAGGGNGTVKVIGHASSRTANMSVERHLEVIFQKSQARANAVAQALIRAGVPADKVQIEAVGDSQPIFYESMPKGEDGNRRAEIFVQS
jgi:outer membrane protein OmpA-like peptidoglycan-associated protein